MIYRRIDDDFLDPTAFRADSMLGVPGLMDVYRAGHVALANAPGTGIADDKVVYAYVPKIIRYYLGEDIDPAERADLRLRATPTDRSYVLEQPRRAGREGRQRVRRLRHAHRPALDRRTSARSSPSGSRPTRATTSPSRRSSLSRVPTIVDDHFEGRHVDLRPYILYGEDIYVLPGGLTRVALQKGSLVVNSSQGGGSKDTWVLSRSADRRLTIPDAAE